MEELELKKLITMFWEGKILIIATILLFATVAGIYSMYMLIPEYKSSITLVLAKTENDANNNISITQTELTLNQKLVSTYSELIKSKAILRHVVNNLGLENISEESLRKNIAVNAVKNTELIQITVVHENREYAANIANEIAKVFTEKVKEIYNINNVYIVDSAEFADFPYNINHAKFIMIATAVGFVVSCSYIVLLNLLDTTVKEVEEIETLTGALVLATIPEFKFEEINKGGKIQWIKRIKE